MYSSRGNFVKFSFFVYSARSGLCRGKFGIAAKQRGSLLRYNEMHARTSLVYVVAAASGASSIV